MRNERMANYGYSLIGVPQMPSIIARARIAELIGVRIENTKGKNGYSDDSTFPDLLGKSVTNSASVLDALDFLFYNDWTETVTNPSSEPQWKDALQSAVREVNARIAVHHLKFDENSTSYLPVRNSSGQIIGHKTIVQLLETTNFGPHVSDTREFGVIHAYAVIAIG